MTIQGRSGKNLEPEKSGGEAICSAEKKTIFNKSVVAGTDVFVCFLWLGAIRL